VSDANDTQNATIAAFQQYVKAVMTERGFDD
jgi:hypothetical protein